LDFPGRDAEVNGAMRQPIHLPNEKFPLNFSAPARKTIGDVCAIPLPPLEQTFGCQAFINTEDRVLVDEQFFGELADAGQAIPGSERSARAVIANLIGDLPRDGDARGCFDSNKQVASK
jgi:hypothetical protein